MLRKYKIHKPFRVPDSQTNSVDLFTLDEGATSTTQSANSTFVFLFGDGTLDSTINGSDYYIYNQVNNKTDATDYALKLNNLTDSDMNDINVQN